MASVHASDLINYGADKTLRQAQRAACQVWAQRVRLDTTPN